MILNKLNNKFYCTININKNYFIKNNNNNNKNDINIKIGDKNEIFKKFTKKEVELFSELSGDKNPIHLNEEYASKTQFKKPLVHGSLVSSLISTAVSESYPGSIYLKQEFNYLKPTFINDKVKAQVTITNIIGKKIYFQTKCITINENENENGNGNEIENNQKNENVVVEGPAIIYHPDIYSLKN